RFEQSVRGLAGKHVRFVENHNFAASGGRSVTHHFAQLADLVDAAIRSRVDFDYVQGSSRGNLLARITDTARIGCRAVHAIERLGQDAGRGGLSHAACAGKNISVGHAIIFDGVGESFRDVRLPNQILEGLWTPFSRVDL